LPKVFYHGTNASKPIEVFRGENDELGRKGIYFSTSKNIAQTYNPYEVKENLYKVFLKFKNPLIVDFKGLDYNSKEGKIFLKDAKSKRTESHDSVIFKNIRDDNANGSGEVAYTVVVFDSKQIKGVDNKGIEGKYFNEYHPNIYYSNATIGGGMLGGAVNGFETDEKGNISFNPSKFALGFLGGALATKSASLAIKEMSKVATMLNKNQGKSMSQNTKEQVLRRIDIKTASKLSKEELDSMPIASQIEFEDFLDKIAKKDYVNVPEILKIAELNKNLLKSINESGNGNVFITRARGQHISIERKSKYGQGLRGDELKDLPSIINTSKEAYKAKQDNFNNTLTIIFIDKKDDKRINMIHLVKDERRNFILTAQKVDKRKLNAYEKLSQGGNRTPDTRTLP